MCRVRLQVSESIAMVRFGPFLRAGITALAMVALVNFTIGLVYETKGSKRRESSERFRFIVAKSMRGVEMNG